MPDLDGGVVTADALHLHDETVHQVVEDKHGDMLVGLKGNQETLLDEVVAAFDNVAPAQPRKFKPSVVQALVRWHWGVENRLHHVKDRTMLEDRYRARANVGANVGLIRSIVVIMKARLKGKVKRLAGKLRAGVDFAIGILLQPL
jgi:predicted transposase YbfD/YdcC